MTKATQSVSWGRRAIPGSDTVAVAMPEFRAKQQGTVADLSPPRLNGNRVRSVYLVSSWAIRSAYPGAR